jgi:hypothetical protein
VGRALARVRSDNAPTVAPEIGLWGFCRVQRGQRPNDHGVNEAHVQLTAYGTVNAPGVSVETARCAVSRMAARRSCLIRSLIRSLIRIPGPQIRCRSPGAPHMKPARSPETTRAQRAALAARLLRESVDGRIFT